MNPFVAMRDVLRRRHNEPYRFRPLEAAEAAFRLGVNPDDTGWYGKLVASLAGRSPARFAKRIMATPEGRWLFEHQPDLLGALRDRERLHALPNGTLGKAYAEFADAEGISGDVLADVLEEYIPWERLDARAPEEKFIGEWMRDSHDLYHLILGYHTDLIGEVAVLTFSGVQTRHTGVLASVMLGQLYLARYPDGRRMAADAVRRALRADLFPMQNWVARLEQPIEQIRAELNVGPPPQYKPLFTRKVEFDRADSAVRAG